jgi:MHS family proline/betaine transporter-like MFS transporter
MLIAPIGAHIRSQLEESLVEASGPDGGEAGSEKEFVRTSQATWKGEPSGHRAYVGRTIAAYMVSFYLPTYAIWELGMSRPMALFGAALTGAMTFALAPIVGELTGPRRAQAADRYLGRSRVRAPLFR